MSAFPAGGNFLFWQKRKSPKKVARERERVGAERSDGSSLRWALGSLIGGWWPMPVAGWCYRSFANSFTLCLIVQQLTVIFPCVSLSPVGGRPGWGPARIGLRPHPIGSGASGHVARQAVRLTLSPLAPIPTFPQRGKEQGRRHCPPGQHRVRSSRA